MADWIKRVRKSDPETSHEAAASQTEQANRAVHKWVLAIMAEVDTATDEEIADLYADQDDAPLHTADGLRHRRAELVEAGWLINTGELRFNRSNRRARVWALSSTWVAPVPVAFPLTYETYLAAYEANIQEDV